MSAPKDIQTELTEPMNINSEVQVLPTAPPGMDRGKFLVSSVDDDRMTNAPVNSEAGKIGKAMVVTCLGVSVTSLLTLICSNLAGGAVQVAYFIFALVIPILTATAALFELGETYKVKHLPESFRILATYSILLTVAGLASIFWAIGPLFGIIFILTSAALLPALIHATKRLETLNASASHKQDSDSQAADQNP